MSVADLEVTIFDTKLKEERDYWIERLSFEQELSNVGLDHDRPSEYSPVKQVVEVCLSGPDFQRLVELTSRSPVLLNATLMAAVSVVLHKYTESRNVVVGSPVLKDSNGIRQRPNVLAIVNEMNGRMSFRQLLLKVRETLFEAYARPRYPFNRLVNDLRLENGNRCPLFDCVLMIRDLHTPLPEISNDITLIFGNDKDCLTGFIEFNPHLFERRSIERFGRHLFNTLHQALHHIDKPVSQFNLLTEEERQQILVDWNNTGTVYPQCCMHQLFETQVARTPEAIAVQFLEERLTYRELNERSNQLAHYLQRFGVGPETRSGCVFGSFRVDGYFPIGHSESWSGLCTVGYDVSRNAASLHVGRCPHTGAHHATRLNRQTAGLRRQNNKTRRGMGGYCPGESGESGTRNIC